MVRDLNFLGGAMRAMSENEILLAVLSGIALLMAVMAVVLVATS